MVIMCQMYNVVEPTVPCWEAEEQSTVYSRAKEHDPIRLKGFTAGDCRTELGKVDENTG